MKIRMHVTNGGEPWWEDANVSATTLQEALEKATAIVARYNDTITILGGDKQRTLIEIQPGGNKGESHSWRKSNLVTIIKKGVCYDEYTCTVCGCKARRYEINKTYVRVGQYSKKKYKFCRDITADNTTTGESMADKADKAKEKADEHVEDAKLKREAEKAQEEIKRRDTVKSYQQLVSDVEDLKIMCETRAFQNFVKGCKKQIEAAKASLLTAKPNEVVQHQSIAKVSGDLLIGFRNPVDELVKFIDEMPLFSDEFKTRAQWNQELMRVEIRNIK
jgi:hypothetical protein